VWTPLTLALTSKLLRQPVLPRGWALLLGTKVPLEVLLVLKNAPKPEREEPGRITRF
jgi:hypothetical protein